MGMEIDLGGVDGLVPQPQGDDRALDAGLEEFHGGAVPENVRRDLLLPQGRYPLAGDRHVLGHQVLNRIDTEPATVDIWEEELGTLRFPQPLLQRHDGRGGQWRTSVLASLAQATDVGPLRQADGIPVEANQLGHTHAGLDAEQEQGVVAAPDPGRTSI